jgi:hypothetical protein
MDAFRVGLAVSDSIETETVCFSHIPKCLWLQQKLAVPNFEIPGCSA